MINYNKYLGDISDEIKASYVKVQSHLWEQFRDTISSIMRILSSQNTLTEASIEAMKKTFDTLLQFIAFRESLNKDESGDLIPQDFADKVEIVTKAFSVYFHERQKNFEDALEGLDISALEDVLSMMHKWHPFFTHIREIPIHSPGVDLAENLTLWILSKVQSYPEMVKITVNKIKDLQSNVIGQDLVNELTIGNKKECEKFYEELNAKLTILLKVNQLANHISDGFLTNIIQECLKSLDEKLEDVSRKALQILDKTPLFRSDADAFNNLYGNMISFAKIVKAAPLQSSLDLSKFSDKILNKVQDIASLASESSDIEQVKDHLIRMKTLSDYLFNFKEKIYQKIDEVLNLYRTKNGGQAALIKLGTLLNQDQGSMGSLIVSEHKCFEGYARALFNTKIRKHGLDYVLTNIHGDNIDKTLLKKRYDTFNSLYKGYIKQYLNPKMDLEPLISETFLIAGVTRQMRNQIIWDAKTRCKVPKLMACIFALWTLKNSQHYFDAENLVNKEEYLLQPHAAQVISIFRMLGIGDQIEELNNNLAQMGTGEGKSITLAVTASVLALLGFDVNCACYSEYLSQRDYTAFQSLFDSLNVLNHIHYGTFNKFCERIINQNGDIRQKVADIILNASSGPAVNNQFELRPKILLIDEADVFFGQDFFGNLYTPSSTLQNHLSVHYLTTSGVTEKPISISIR